MSYITAEFGRRVAMPPRPKLKIEIPPGKTPLQHMIEMARNEGQAPESKAKARPRTQPYEVKTRSELVRSILSGNPKTTAELSEIIGLSYDEIYRGYLKPMIYRKQIIGDMDGRRATWRLTE